MYANMNPAERYAMNLGNLPPIPQNGGYGTVPVPTGKRQLTVPGVDPVQNWSGSTFVPYAPKSQEYDYQFGTQATSNGMPTWAWVAIAAAGGLILFYALK